MRDIYTLGDKLLMIATDRISVFNHLLHEPIRDKGRILTGISQYWFRNTKDIIYNHIIDNPDPAVLVVEKCDPVRVEVVVRNYMVGSLWRDYAAGKRVKCGITLPEGLEKNQRLDAPIITPTFKSKEDEEATPEQLIASGALTADLWNEMEAAALKLFDRGTLLAKQNGLILLDTKYEFGLNGNHKLTLIDEIHTPDSSRFWFEGEKELRFPDKEFAREWVHSHGFAESGVIPHLPEEVQKQIRAGYIEVYKAITGSDFVDIPGDAQERMLHNLQAKGYIK